VTLRQYYWSVTSCACVEMCLPSRYLETDCVTPLFHCWNAYYLETSDSVAQPFLLGQIRHNTYDRYNITPLSVSLSYKWLLYFSTHFYMPFLFLPSEAGETTSACLPSQNKSSIRHISQQFPRNQRTVNLSNGLGQTYRKPVPLFHYAR
jgi:hypothetical protein